MYNESKKIGNIAFIIYFIITIKNGQQYIMFQHICSNVIITAPF